MSGQPRPSNRAANKQPRGEAAVSHAKFPCRVSQVVKDFAHPLVTAIWPPSIHLGGERLAAALAAVVDAPPFEQRLKFGAWAPNSFRVFHELARRKDKAGGHELATVAGRRHHATAVKAFRAEATRYAKVNELASDGHGATGVMVTVAAVQSQLWFGAMGFVGAIFCVIGEYMQSTGTVTTSLSPRLEPSGANGLPKKLTVT